MNVLNVFFAFICRFLHLFLENCQKVASAKLKETNVEIKTICEEIDDIKAEEEDLKKLMKKVSMIYLYNVESFLFLGPMFVVCQFFSSSWGSNFVLNWFVSWQYTTFRWFVKRSWGSKFLNIPRTSIPDEQSWFHSLFILYLFIIFSVRKCFCPPRCSIVSAYASFRENNMKTFFIKINRYTCLKIFKFNLCKSMCLSCIF